MTSKPVYQNLELQPIGGQWRAGSASRNLDVTDPFTGEQRLSLPMATRKDLDEAYRKAAQAQVEWAAMGPTARGQIMRRAAEIFDVRTDAGRDWLRRAARGTRIQAPVEGGAVRGVPRE